MQELKDNTRPAPVHGGMKLVAAIIAASCLIEVEALMFFFWFSSDCDGIFIILGTLIGLFIFAIGFPILAMVVSRLKHLVAMIVAVSLIIVCLGGVVGLVFLYKSECSSDPSKTICARNIHALYLALNEYGIDMKLADGATVDIYRLAPRYITHVDLFKCPTCNLIYGTNFIYGTIPRCPGNVKGHVWTPTETVDL